MSALAHAALDALVSDLGLRARVPGETVVLGEGPVFPCRFPLAELAAAAIGACGLAVREIHEHRTGRSQEVHLALRHAGASLLSFAFVRGGAAGIRAFPATTALYRDREGRWIHLHGGFPHLAEGTLRVLGCADDARAIASNVAARDAFALEDALAEAGLCGAVVRSAAEWARHPQGRALAAAPLVEVTRIGEGPPVPLGPASRPLSGLRVLDLTRVLAGPTCGRSLAEHGADVLRVLGPGTPDIEPFLVDTGHGKRSAEIDLDRAEGVATLRALAGEADVFVDGYRTGALARRGFGPEELARLRPGIIAVAVNCYGFEGPWAGRPGWEQLAQSVTGLALAHGGEATPGLVPAAACDYTTGALAALGTGVALLRRAREGGSFRVRVSLSRTGQWIHAHDTHTASAGGGSLEAALRSGGPPGFTPEEIASYSTGSDTAWGRLSHLLPVLRLSETPARWDRPSPARAADAPRWLGGPAAPA